MNPDQLREVDAALINSPTPLYIRTKALLRINPKENGELYSRVRDLALKERDSAALTALAKFQKIQDIGAIQNEWKQNQLKKQSQFSIYRAISYFPDDTFFPMLEQEFKKVLSYTAFETEHRELYGAIAGYQNEKARRLLSLTFSETGKSRIGGYHLKYLRKALTRFNHPIYDGLRNMLDEREKPISSF